MEIENIKQCNEIEDENRKEWGNEDQFIERNVREPRYGTSFEEQKNREQVKDTDRPGPNTENECCTTYPLYERK